MPALARKTQKVFGSSLVPSGNLAVFGSLAAGSPAFSNDPDAIQSLSNFLSGLNGAVVGNRSPAIEDLNSLFFLFARQIAYILQSGIPEWDVSTEYFTNNFVRVSGVVYVSKTDNNTGNDPTTDTNNWESYASKIAPSATSVKAWVNFNGTNGALIGAYNVSGVLRTAAGRYLIAFQNPLANANYAVVGTCGPANGGSITSPPGNNNHVCRDVTTTTTHCSVWIPKPDQTFGEDADLVSVVIYGS